MSDCQVAVDATILKNSNPVCRSIARFLSWLIWSMTQYYHFHKYHKLHKDTQCENVRIFLLLRLTMGDLFYEFSRKIPWLDWFHVKCFLIDPSIRLILNFSEGYLFTPSFFVTKSTKNKVYYEWWTLFDSSNCYFQNKWKQQHSVENKDFFCHSYFIWNTFWEILRQ